MEKEARRALQAIDPESLIEMREVQVFKESGLAILVHVVEHFSYHAGQISYSVKSRKDIDLGYYDGVELSRASSPPRADAPKME